MHDNLPLSSDDDKLFAWETQLAINLFSAGHTWFDLDSTSRDSLAGIVQYSRLPGYMAGGISSLIGTTPITWPLPVLDSAGYVSSLSYYGSQGLGSKSNSNLTSNSIASNTNCQFSVNPNPTNGNLTIQAPSSGTFIICTLFGQQIQKNYVNSGQTFLQLPPSISPGMYICKFISINGESVKEMKLLYQQP